MNKTAQPTTGSRRQCRVCDSTDLQPAVDLGMQPWCNHFLKPEQVGTEPSYPLRVVWCADCRTAQLDFTVKKEIMFGDHTYLSGVTRSLSDHFRDVAGDVDRRFAATCGPRKSVLDIGSNDGTQLKHFRDLGYEVLGVESSKTTARIANDAGIDTLNEFFNLDVACSLNRKFDVVNAAGVFFHLEELHSVTDGIRQCLAADGVFVVQFLYMKRIVDNLAFDQIYHEHLLYYNLRTIETLLNRHGLGLFDARIASIHGGSVIAYVGHLGRRQPSPRLEALRAAEEESSANELETYRDFAVRIEQMKEENLAFLDEAKRLGQRVYGVGAPVKGSTLLNYVGIGTRYLDCLVEKNALRKGLFSPGQHIPVVLEHEIENPPDIYYVLAWNFRQEILANNRHLLDRGVQFYFPVIPQDVYA